MGKNLAIFLLCFAISFGGGYLAFGGQSDGGIAPEQGQQTAPQQETQKDEAAVAASVPKEGEVFANVGCISCHSVGALGVKGGATGPDLSNAYAQVEGKHGVPIEQFLKKPTSAVMSGVIGGKPLTDEELTAVLNALKLASEKK